MRPKYGGWRRGRKFIFLLPTTTLTPRPRSFLPTPHVLWLQDTSRCRQIVQICKQNCPVVTHGKRAQCKLVAWIKAGCGRDNTSIIHFCLLLSHFYNEAQWFNSWSPDQNTNFLHLFSCIYLSTYCENLDTFSVVIIFSLLITYLFGLVLLL